MPNSPKIRNDKSIVAPMKIQRDNCDLSQIQSFLYILSSFIYISLYDFSPPRLARNLITESFWIENNTAKVRMIEISLMNPTIDHARFTAQLQMACA